MANATTPPHGIRPLITAAELGEIFRRSPSTILSDLRRAPHRVPPPCTPPGTRRPLWRPEDVEAWLRAAAAQPPARRPRKKRSAANTASASQIAAQVAADLDADASARVQGSRATPPGEPAQPGPEASA